MYNLNWKEIRTTRQIKFHHIIGFRIIPEAAAGGVRKKDVLKNFANFTGKNLYRNLLLIKLHVWKLFFKNPYFEKDLRTTASVISKVSVNPKDNGFTVPGNYIIVLCYNGTPPQTSVLKFSQILWGYSGWWLPELSQKTKIRLVLALKSLFLPQLMSFWWHF